ncbi:synaptotagmin-15-like [Anneissia japonica]|uniref:synaptotagmin-15-like n=1 Tax=Anneissia japonica TaxID=1529436 RepID=UPI001425955B|nr:synaptotagmin-15-like [Anneissia japonica]
MICEGIQIKVQLMQRRKVIKCKKTSVVRGTCDPIFNEAFVFNIASDHMEMTSIMLKFVRSPSSKLGSSSHDYGFVNTGPFMLARGEELLHWQEMMAQPKKPVTKWHSITTMSNDY